MSSNSDLNAKGRPPSNRGKLVSLIILGVALAAAAFSAWYHFQGSRQVLAFWGPEAGVLIAQAPEVEALVLGPTGGGEPSAARESSAPSATAHEPLVVGEQRLPVEKSRSVTGARGILNIRRALVLDITFDWQTEAGPPPRWTHALEFRQADDRAVLLFDFNSRQVALLGANRAVRLDPAASDDIRLFFAEQFEATE